MNALLANPAQAAQMGRAGHAFVQAFSWRAIAQRHVELYSQLIGGPALRRAA
jgi:glycosyltransferase involved in cell wall biosynthesis